MKPIRFALLLCAAPMAFGQMTIPEPRTPPVQEPGSQEPLFQMPPQGAPQPYTFKLEPGLKGMPTVEAPVPRVLRNGPKIDPKIIRRPLPGSFRQQEPRTPMAHNLYPDLKLLPIDTARLEPAPAASPLSNPNQGRSTTTGDRK